MPNLPPLLQAGLQTGTVASPPWSGSPRQCCLHAATTRPIHTPLPSMPVAAVLQPAPQALPTTAIAWRVAPYRGCRH